MRLIDADTVQMKLYEECQNIRHFDKNREKSQIFADGIDFAWVMLDNQPTEKAIPVEWIEKFIDNDILSETVKILLNAWEWEKENEISVMPVNDNSTIPLDYLGERK